MKPGLGYEDLATLKPDLTATPERGPADGSKLPRHGVWCFTEKIPCSPARIPG
jgi:hypothetical protein